ncbi:RDD family protein [Sphaerospermopsis sp. FACHB-1194]|uniref:RDD family protein n=1 Tax=Sphaerospermopsis sp. FACHB-1194 TaxID=2692862 RepID=UPI0016819F61|nr:RDD family protein [Sphaerospermopsis sp. FACHB-1194]MBD2145667.1 RDD family protein [Sphaerospermopsis sp. FACHB-1194]
MYTNKTASLTKRCAASQQDGFITLVLSAVITMVSNPPDNNSLVITGLTVYILLGWIYSAGMESSSIQATFGKRISGIMVTDANGNKISFARASARYFSKRFFILPWILAFHFSNNAYSSLSVFLLLIGFALLIIGPLMAVFTPEKQALHDLIARSLVINGIGQSINFPWKFLILLITGAILAGKILVTLSTTPNNVGCSLRSNSNIFQEQLMETNAKINPNINGNWQLEFASGFTQIPVTAILSIHNASGIMLVRLPNQGGTQTIKQNVVLCSSNNTSLVLLGENPVDVNTEQPSSNYNPDNFRIDDVGVERKPVFSNYYLDGNNTWVPSTSQVKSKFSGYSSVAIEMIESQDGKVVITKVTSESNAEKAGLKPGDIISSVDSTSISSIQDVNTVVKSSTIDSTLKFEISRGDETLNIDVKPDCCVNP